MSAVHESRQLTTVEGSPATRPPWLTETALPCASRFLEIDGKRIHYIDEGRGPVVLMTHGGVGWSLMYAELIRELGGSFRCIALDFPGFGLSAEPASRPGFRQQQHVLRLFIEKLDLRDITLVTSDTSGPAALATLLESPQRFRRLVVGSAFAWPLHDYPGRLGRMVRLLASPLGFLLFIRLNLLMRIFTFFSNRRRSMLAAVRRAYMGSVADMERRRHMSDMFRAIFAEQEFLRELEQGISALELPVLLAYGRDDPALHAGFAQRWQSLLPQARLELLERAGHFPMVDAPEELARIVRTWLA